MTARPQIAQRSPWFVMLNAASGKQDDGLADQIRATTLACGIPCEVIVVDDPAQLQEKALAVVSDVKRQGGLLVAAGGDGTINALAAVAVEHQIPFTVIPQGTFNYFGRNHHIPEDTDQAIAAIASGELTAIQVGSVNGRIFLVNASLGLYAKLLEDREAFKRRWGRSRLTAMFAALRTLCAPQPRLRLRLSTDTGDTRELHCTTVFVGNNRLQLEQIGVPEVEALAHHQLVGLTLRPTGIGKLLVALWKGAVGKIADVSFIERTTFRQLRVEPARWLRKRRYPVATDGEQIEMSLPIVFKVLDQPLWFLAPSRNA